MNNVFLIQADGKLPNLALMRLSTFFKSQGKTVRWADERMPMFREAGQIFGSSIFRFSTRARLRWDALMWPDRIHWGGTGVNVPSSLMEVATIPWETVTPDYEIYPDYKFSLGFTQRGCSLSCKFCVVPEKEGRPVSVGTIPGIWRGDPHPRKIVLLDNDFFGQLRDSWQARIREIREGGGPVPELSTAQKTRRGGRRAAVGLQHL